ncbi:MAG: tetratricopeptide repeat protein, partial [Rhodospirillales bacterium]|nr:tetratricopeptide repeat protein [Rhodospirillales bacterium]
MQQVRRVRRAALLALTLLSACAAADPSSGGAPPVRASAGGSSVFGAYLAGKVALSQGNADAAANAFLRALAARPNDPELQQQAFFAALLAGRSEAAQLARQLPDNQMALLVIGDEAAKASRWAEAERAFRALPRQGLTQLLQPLLIAWAQQGDGRTDVALATLRPLVEGPRFRGLFALHAGMIADVANRPADAARFYRIAQTEMPDSNLRLAQVLASWQARTGHPAEAQRLLANLVAAAPDMAIAVPTLLSTAGKRPVARPTDGMAEAYVALAAALHAERSTDVATAMLRLALDLRPDFSAARVMQADLLAPKQPAAALQMLAGIPASDPISAIVRLRRVSLMEKLGRSDDAVEELDKLARDYPESPLPEMTLGDMLRIKQRFPAAIAAYDRAAARIRQPGPNDWPLYYNRGIAYERANQWSKAEADFKHALALAPDQPFVLNYLGYSWADKGEHLPEARRMLQRAAEKRPNDGAVVDSLGWVMLRQGQVADAVRLLERAVELDSEDATINGHLGHAYW